MSTKSSQVLWKQIKESLERRQSIAVEVLKLEEENLSTRRAIREMILRRSELESKRSVVIQDVSLFLSSANAAMRANLDFLIQKRGELSIQASNLQEKEMELLHRLLSSAAVKRSVIEIPFELCPEGPKTLSERWSSQVQDFTSEDSQTLLQTLNANLKIFAQAKAFAGSSTANIVKAKPSDEKVDGFDTQSGPYPFDEEDSPDNIVYSRNGARIKQITLHKLIENLTCGRADMNMREVVLLTYHSFSTPMEMLQLLIRRFYMPTPLNLTMEEFGYWEDKVQHLIRAKVISVIKSWIMGHFGDFEDENVRQYLRDFMTQVKTLGEWCHAVASPVLSLLNAKEEREGQAKRKAFKVPKALWDQEDIQKFENDLLKASDETIAEQITWRDFNVFKEIHPRELLNQRWTKENKYELAPNLTKLIDRFNQVCSWCQSFILSFENESDRSLAVKKALRIASHLQMLRNFNSLRAVYTALQANPIFRLKVMKTLPSKQQKYLEELNALFSTRDSHKTLRTVMENAESPSIPHVGIFLTDLVHLDDANPNEEEGRINFLKLVSLNGRIQKVKDLQGQGYNIKAEPATQIYFEQKMVDVDPDLLYARSLKLEPRR